MVPRTTLPGWPRGAIHMAYSFGSSWGPTELRYATNESGEWRTETIETGFATPTGTAIDAGGRVHVAWVTVPAPGSAEVRHAVREVEPCQ